MGTIRTAKNWSVVAWYVEMAPAKMAPLVRVVGATQIATVDNVGRALVVVKSDQMADGNLGETESVKRVNRARPVAMMEIACAPQMAIRSACVISARMERLGAIVRAMVIV